MDSQTKDMLDRQFGIERAKASQRIIDLSAKHEMIVADFIRNNLSHDWSLVYYILLFYFYSN